MKSSTFSRTIELAKLAARVGIKEIRSGSMKSRFEQAILIAQSLSGLKGAAMKVGQLLSLDLSHYFPPEAIEILSQLQNAAVAHPFDEMQRLLLKELGDTKLEKIQNLSTTPIGIASIGQVHRAQYQGRDIVLKLQYPGVDHSINSDLNILKTISTSFCSLTGRRMDLNPLFQELRTLLEQEVNYRCEAQLQKQYKLLISEMDSERYFSYFVPDVIDELSTNRVIAMSFSPGLSLRSWFATKPSRDQREALAIAVLDLYFYEFFKWGLVQTDPNWANFLIHEKESKPSLVLLDFGATRTYSSDFIQKYIRLLHFAASRDSKVLKEHVIDFGLMDPRESDSAFLVFEEMLNTAIRPFFSKQSDSSLFDFSDQSHSLNAQMAAKALVDELIYSPPPYALVFLHRKLAGVYSILKTLGVQLDVSGYWEKMLAFSSKNNA